MNIDYIVNDKRFTPYLFRCDNDMIVFFKKNLYLSKGIHCDIRICMCAYLNKQNDIISVVCFKIIQGHGVIDKKRLVIA